MSQSKSSRSRTNPERDALIKELNQLRKELIRVMVGVDRPVDWCLIGLLAGGNVLIEDVPGTGKTMLAKALANLIDAKFNRVQCTPDLLPFDVTGGNIFNPKTNEFEFRPGPVFANILLADELNRATPRTQSALLEAMGEQSVTIDSKTYELVRPFFVVATQNSRDFEGTYNLPEAELDRFLLRFSIGYPTVELEDRILQAHQKGDPLSNINSVITPERIVQLQNLTRAVHVAPAIREYILRLVNATREHQDLRLGASLRASLGLVRASQAQAVLAGRDYVLPDDVKAIAEPVLVHRLILTLAAQSDGRRPERVIEHILARVPLPVAGPAEEVTES